jgi:CheY-like chemotaxis protein
VHLLHNALVEVERVLSLKAPNQVELGVAITRAEVVLTAFESVSPTARSAHTILIVDDDADIRTTFSQILRDEGYSTLAARNGADALQLLHERERPCVLLLDLMMPVVDGWEVIGRLNHYEEMAGVPIIVITAFVEHAPTDRRISAVLKKPVEADTLIETVAKFCNAA